MTPYRLFIYTGAGYREYNVPQAISHSFAKEESFAISLFVYRRPAYTAFRQALGENFSRPRMDVEKPALGPRLRV